MEPTSAAEALSTYERTRALNIERNNARLRQLGLITEEEERQSNNLAWKRTTTTASESPQHAKRKLNTVKDTRKRKYTSKVQSTPSRKSLRVQGMDPVGAPLSSNDNFNDQEDDLHRIRQTRVEQCRKARQLAALRYSLLSEAEKRAAKENPTATYEHCLRRVRTLSEKALYNRVRAIERAAGKHCVIKMGTILAKLCVESWSNRIKFESLTGNYNDSICQF